LRVRTRATITSVLTARLARMDVAHVEMREDFRAGSVLYAVAWPGLPAGGGGDGAVVAVRAGGVVWVFWR
jgi:hypothetical protein